MIDKIESTLTRVEPETSKLRSVLLFLAVAAATFFQKPAPALMWDAAEYLRGSMALVSGRDIYAEGGLSFRGVWTPIIYSPAAAVNQILGRGGYGGGLYVVVLLQGALLVAAICVLLLPAVLRLWFPQNSMSQVVCVIVGYVVLRNFAPYSVMDVWAIALILLAICLLARQGMAALLFAGLALGVSANLRPAYILTALAITVVTVAYLRWRGLMILGGLVLAQIPQVAVNWFVNEKVTPFPVDLASLSRQTSTFASYVVRYDTIAYRPWAQGGQFFCDPAMVRVAMDKLPSNYAELITLFGTNPLLTARFLFQRLGAVLLWPVTVPYFEWIPILNLLFGVVIVLITILGISGLVLTRTESSKLSLPRVATLVVIAGVLVNLVLVHAESRYAIPLVLIGIVGIAGLVGQGANRGIRRTNIRGGLPAVIAVLTFAVLLSVSGYEGLQHADSCPTAESLKNAQTEP